MCAALVTMRSCVAAVEALFVDEIDGVGAGAVEKYPLVVLVIVLHLQLLLLQLVALPLCLVLDTFDLPTQRRHVTQFQRRATIIISAAVA